MGILESSPTADEDGITDELIEPLMKIDISGKEGGCRMAMVCHVCFHLIQPDMWVSPEGWQSANPKVKYLDLPPFDHGVNNG